MPPRLVAKPRTWGTRYDSLGPCSTPSSPEVPTNPPSSPPRNMPTSVMHPPTHLLHTPEKHISTNNATSPEKTPHDASIFVGSLPSHIDHNELTRLLSEHLAEHTEIKSVKVVRDNKGGVCAFMQCEDAPSAAKLIETLQSQPPKSFLGRYLRFEPARAFRTLLVSYRAPTQFIRANSALDTPSQAMAGDSQLVTLEPASAMRIFRPHPTKYLAIAYNEDAKGFDVHPGVDTSAPATDPFLGNGLILDPLQYDADTIRLLAAAFGPVESFGKFITGNAGDQNIQNEGTSNRDNLHPHDAPRSTGMADDIWEIKWKHREDCVTALMTLRRIPHITVTWAHQQLHPLSTASGESRLSSPNVTPTPQLGPFASPTRPRSFVQAYGIGSPSDYQRVNGIRASLSFPRGYSTDIPVIPFKLSPSAPHTMAASASEGGTLPPSGLLARGVPLISGSRSHVDMPIDSVNAKWSESDFPPLHMTPNMSERLDSLLGEPSSIPRSNDSSERHASPSPSSSLSVQPATPIPADADKSNTEEGPRDTADPSQSSPSRDLCQSDVDLVQELTIPATPEFSADTLTPATSASMQSYPRTPQSANISMAPVEVVDVFHGIQHIKTPKKFGEREDVDSTYQSADQVKYYDPFTIFVGGLDMFGSVAWDEARLKSVFGRYGEVEDIQVVRPLAKRSGFAFVRFKYSDAGARAVAGEHNRLHDGHQIRVQLRENNPHRSPWKAVRARGKAPVIAPEQTTHQGAMHSGQNIDDAGRGASNTGQNSVGQDTQNTHASVHCIPTANNIPTGYLPFPWHDSSRNLPSPETAGLPKAPYPVRTDSTSTTASVSPSPSTLAQPQAAMPATIPQYPFPMGMGYYPNQPWMQPYVPYPYTYPYMPHGYIPCPQTAFSASQDGGAYPHGTQLSWPAVNDSNKSQVAVVHREQSPFPPAAYPAHTTQPPLRPTGFMQGEQGTLIPLYQPDALNRYMSTNRQADTPPVLPPPSGQHSMMWAQYPQMTMHPYGYPPPTMMPAAPQPTSNGPNSWSHTQVPMPYGSYPGQQHPPSQPPLPSSASSLSNSTTSSYRHSAPGAPSHLSQQVVHQPSNARRYQRRDPHFNKQNHHAARFFKANHPDGLYESQINAGSQRHNGSVKANGYALSGQS
ncbi:hypothetical protein BXZ70DRAFT_291551 [Cristinia sonorae]|uniref:RRM domain-containing protein n=1 Tax=Cristinia sonorae TaxID=1940300 RepID=A0A8K0UM60_9AGAR|nr:hypothetical protein BXZ70DRAFT_291551 [Cristinia sonorae]